MTIRASTNKQHILNKTTIRILFAAVIAVFLLIVIFLTEDNNNVYSTNLYRRLLTSNSQQNKEIIQPPNDALVALQKGDENNIGGLTDNSLNKLNNQANSAINADLNTIDALIKQLTALQHQLREKEAEKQDEHKKIHQQNQKLQTLEKAETKQEMSIKTGTEAGIDNNNDPHSDLQKNLHEQVAQIKKTVEQLKHKEKGDQGEIDQLQSKIQTIAKQLSASQNQYEADKSLIGAIDQSKSTNIQHECDFDDKNNNKCNWSKINIQLGPAFNTHLFIINNPPKHIQTSLEFVATQNSDPRCHMNVLLGLNEICRIATTGNTDNEGDKKIKPIGHLICQLHFGGDKPQNCDQCNGVSFDLHTLSKSVDLAKPESISKMCLVVKQQTVEAGGENGCSTIANIAITQSKDITGHKNSCPQNEASTTESMTKMNQNQSQNVNDMTGPTKKQTKRKRKITDNTKKEKLKNKPETNAVIEAETDTSGASWTNYAGFWPIMATIACVMAGILGVFCVAF